MTSEWPWLSPAEPGWEHGQFSFRWIYRRFSDMEVEPDSDAKWRALAEMQGAANLLSIIKWDVDVLVHEARARGATWEEIGEKLEMRKQSVHEKYRAGLPQRDIKGLNGDVEVALEWAAEILHDPDADIEDQEEAQAVIQRFGSRKST